MRPKTLSNVRERFHKRERHYENPSNTHAHKRDEKRAEDRRVLIERYGTPLNFRTAGQRKGDGKRWRKAHRLARRMHAILWMFFVRDLYRGVGRKGRT